MIKRHSYKEQLERIKRYYKRLEQINKGIPPSKNGIPEVSFLDEFYAFFIFCRHLEDWIIQDRNINIPQKGKILRKFMQKNICLKVCTEICNGIKHVDPTKKRAEFDNVHNVTLKIKNGDWESIADNFYVLTNKGKKDAFELATECLNKWEEFIREHIEKKN